MSLNILFKDIYRIRLVILLLVYGLVYDFDRKFIIFFERRL